MASLTRSRTAGAFVLLALTPLVAAALTACSDPVPENPTLNVSLEETSTGADAQPVTAKKALDTARAAAKEKASDAKLLVVQTAQPAKPGEAPMWGYVFGSPSQNKTYMIYIHQGKAMPSEKTGEAGLTKEQWAKIPGDDAWPIDSDKAYEAALRASGSQWDPDEYSMALQTIVKKPDPGAAFGEALKWYVTFDFGAAMETTAPIAVDAKTGEVTSK